MKRIFIFIILFTFSGTGFAQEFYVGKVNRIEKLWVIPVDRRSFVGSRGVQKFDYGRPIPPEDRGEHYVVAWGYKGKELNVPLVLKFEYKLALDPKELCTEECSYNNIKRGTYKWTFKNIGPRFEEKGKVDRWKVSLVLEGEVVAEKNSSTWQSMEGT